MGELVCNPPSCAQLPVAVGDRDPLPIRAWGRMRPHRVGRPHSGPLLRAWHFVSLGFPHVVCGTWSLLACWAHHTACPFSRVSSSGSPSPVLGSRDQGSTSCRARRPSLGNDSECLAV